MSVSDVAVSHWSSELVAFCGAMEVGVWNLSTSELVCTLEGHTRIVRSAAFSFCSDDILASGGDDETVRVWRLSGHEHECEVVFRGHVSCIRTIAFSPHDVDRLASAAETVKVWRRSTKKCIWTIEGAVGVSFSPHDDDELATIDMNALVQLWWCSTRECHTSIECPVLGRHHTLAMMANQFHVHYSPHVAGEVAVSFHHPYSFSLNFVPRRGTERTGDDFLVLPSHTVAMAYVPAAEDILATLVTVDETVRFHQMSTGKCLGVLRLGTRPHEAIAMFFIQRPGALTKRAL